MSYKDSYITIFTPAQDFFIEKKSKFIGYISPCQSVEQANSFITEISKKHYDATHNCFAYLLRDGGILKCSDNGEPQGTAGVPILEVIKKEELTNVCIVVTRYYGGILLGAGGLIRAYSKGASIACKAADIKQISMCKVFLITFDYSLYGKIQYILPNYLHKLISSDFSSEITLEILIYKKDFEKINNELTELSNGQIKLQEKDELFSYI
ncbi:MAG: YigZ family protein [Oscillospiraceae bacterium]